MSYNSYGVFIAPENWYIVMMYMELWSIMAFSGLGQRVGRFYWFVNFFLSMARVRDRLASRPFRLGGSFRDGSRNRGPAAEVFDI